MDDFYTKNEFTPASEISVHQLVNALSDAAFVCDRSGRVVVCSDQALLFFGLSDKSKIIGSNFQSYIAYEHIDAAYYMLLSVVNETNRKKSGIFLVRKGLKETINSNVTFSSIISTDPSKTYVLLTFREEPVSDSGIDFQHRKDMRISRLFGNIISLNADSSETTRFLLSQIGETLGAITCSYNQLSEGRLIPGASWESPFNTGISPQLCSKQMYDYIKEQNEKIALVRKPLLTTFFESEFLKNEDSVVKSILGFTIVKNNVVEGIITAVFTFNFSLSDIDKQFIEIIFSILEKQDTRESESASPPELSFRQLIDCFTDPVCVLSKEGIIMDVNRGFTKCYGYEREELIGQNALLVSAEEENDNQQFSVLLEKAFLGETQKFDWWGKRKNAEVFPEEIILNKSTYYDRDALIAIARDLTEPKKVEKELLRYNKELEESNTSKDKFFSILAHDLKNPFQGLLGFIDLLYEDLDELSNEQIKEYLSNVRNASYHTYALLENLLEWSRIQSGKMPFTPTVFSIREEINSVISILDNNATRKEIKLVNEVDPVLMVEADRNMMHSVLQNLITNSIKFSNSKGRVVLRSRVPQTNINSKSSGETGNRQWLEVSISDNGIGIPEEILPKLFKLNGQYSQAGTANEPGTGLGLVLCHEMVEKNGGKIWAESIAGQGTTFIFTIPLSN
jgi:PAS domain S-box-containing protein